MLSDLSIAVIGGVIASFIILFVFEILWKELIEPWYEENVYRDAKVEGEWETELMALNSDKGAYKELVSLKRTGHKVTGEIGCISGGEKGRICDVEGTFRNLLLCGTYSELSIPAGRERPEEAIAFHR